ncbi:MAG: cell division protein FtsJ [Spirochaetia bacterium]|nr:cell division protein FtsJ [Spirochaetia bacterium]
MKIFLDDYRPFPDEKGGFNCVRTFEDCINLLNVFKSIDFISLDYDLSSKHTGLDVLMYMYENDIKPDHINIHSSHPDGSSEMLSYAEKFFKDVTITNNVL